MTDDDDDDDEFEAELLRAMTDPTEWRDPRFFDYSILSMARDIRDANCEHDWYTAGPGKTASCTICGRYRPVEDYRLP